MEPQDLAHLLGDSTLGVRHLDRKADTWNFIGFFSPLARHLQSRYVAAVLTASSGFFRPKAATSAGGDEARGPSRSKLCEDSLVLMCSVDPLGNRKRPFQGLQKLPSHSAWARGGVAWCCVETS